MIVLQRLTGACGILNTFLRAYPGKKEAVPKFNRAIKRMLDDGTIERIYSHYR